MDIDKLFGTSKKLELEGVRHEIGDDAWMKIARWNNRRFNELKRQLERRELAKQKGGALDDATKERIAIECIAQTIIVDWGGNLVLHGKPVGAFTPEEAARIMSDTADTNMGDFRDYIVGLSMDLNNFRMEREAEAVKNSPASSAGA
jgi:hypothetical protein